MHAFLSKVFGRKKDEKETSPTTLAPGELLDGRFEAISPNVSPSATKFLELDHKTNGHSGKDKDGGLTLLRAKSRPSSPEIKPKKLDTLPHLSLNFPAPKEDSSTNNLDSFLDPESEILLTDTVIGQRRLNPMEALVLIRACSQAIISRGLETLGIMHPHWYSASPDVQRRLISQFIRSLDTQSPATALSLTTASVSPFESEMDFTSPHDVAAVLRWGLRHLQLEGDSFGTDDGWYKAFLDAEAAADYPPKAFSEKLAPKLPPAHLELLTATLEIFSSLAAHSEVNSTTGSKLSKIFGLWLLTARRVQDKDDWHSFYTRWERTGRMLEHLFLARIREESTDQRMPVRLLDLVRKYPYTQGLSSPTTDLQLLPPSRFTTQHYDALFVRIEIELPAERRKPKSKIHPLNLLADAFSTKIDEGEYAELWAKITAASKDGTNPSPLSNIFADETIRFLSIVPDTKKQEAKSPAFSLLPGSPTSPHKRFFSAGDEKETPVPPTATKHTKPATDPAPLTPISPLAIGSDWAQFSSSGFLDSSPAIAPLVSTLFDTDVERTVPPDTTTLSRKSSKRKPVPSLRKSVDMSSENPTQPPSRGTAEIADPEIKVVVKASNLQIIQIDEAFVDFWSDSLLDPLTSNWPTFIICKFKSTLAPHLLYGPAEEGQKQRSLKWLVLEQVFTVKTVPSPPPPLPTPVDTPIARPASPAQSTSGKKRFSFWSVSRTASSSSVTSQKGKKKEKTPKVGEMGELLEEDRPEPARAKTDTITVKAPTFKSRKSLDVKTSNPVAKPEDKVDKEEHDTKIAEGATTTAVVAAAATGAIATGALLAAVPEDKPLADQQPVIEKTAASSDVADAPAVAAPVEAQVGTLETELSQTPTPETSQGDSTFKAEAAHSTDEAQPAITEASVDEQVSQIPETLVPVTKDQPTIDHPLSAVETVADVETKAIAESEPDASPEAIADEAKAEGPVSALEVSAEVSQSAEPVSAPTDESVVEAVVETELPSEVVVAPESTVEDPISALQNPVHESAGAISVLVDEPVVEETEHSSEAVVAPEFKEEPTPVLAVPAEIPRSTEPISAEPAVEAVAGAEILSEAVVASESKAEEPVSAPQLPVESEVEEPISALQVPMDVSQSDDSIPVLADEPAAEAIAEAEPSSNDVVIPETKAEEPIDALHTPDQVPETAEDVSAPAEEPMADEPVFIAAEHSTLPALSAPELATEVPVEGTVAESITNADNTPAVEELAVSVEDTAPETEPKRKAVQDSEVVAAVPENVEDLVSLAAAAGSVDVVESAPPIVQQAAPETPSADTEADLRSTVVVAEPTARSTSEQSVEDVHISDSEPDRVGNIAAVEDVVSEEPTGIQVEANTTTIVEPNEAPAAERVEESGLIHAPELQAASPFTSAHEAKPTPLIDAELGQTKSVGDDIEETAPMTEEVDNSAIQVSQAVGESQVEPITEISEPSEVITHLHTATSGAGEQPEAEGIDDSTILIPDPLISDPSPVIDGVQSIEEPLETLGLAEKSTLAIVEDPISGTVGQSVSEEGITAVLDPETANVASSVPSIEPISLPQDTSSDDLVELSAVPLVEAIPLPENDDTYITVSLQDSTSGEILPTAGTESLVEDGSNAMSDVFPVPDAPSLSGSTPGPQIALSPLTLDQAVTDIQEESISQPQEDVALAVSGEATGERQVNVQDLEEGSISVPQEETASFEQESIVERDAVVDNSNASVSVDEPSDDLPVEEGPVEKEGTADEQSHLALENGGSLVEPADEDSTAVKEVPAESVPAVEETVASAEVLEEVVVPPAEETSVAMDAPAPEQAISDQGAAPDNFSGNMEEYVPSTEGVAAPAIEETVGVNILPIKEANVENVEENTSAPDNAATLGLDDVLFVQEEPNMEQGAAKEEVTVEPPEDVTVDSAEEAPVDEKTAEATDSVKEVPVAGDVSAEEQTGNQLPVEVSSAPVDEMQVIAPVGEESGSVDEHAMGESVVGDVPVVESRTELPEDDTAPVREDAVIEDAPTIGDPPTIEDSAAGVREGNTVCTEESSVIEELPAGEEEPVLEEPDPEILEDEAPHVTVAPIVEGAAGDEEPDTELPKDADPVKEEPVVEDLPAVDENRALEEPVVEVLDDEALQVEEEPIVANVVVEEPVESVVQEDAVAEEPNIELPDDDVAPVKETVVDEFVLREPVAGVVEDEAAQVKAEQIVPEEQVIDEAPVAEEEPVVEVIEQVVDVDEDANLGKVSVEPVVQEEPIVEEPDAELLEDDAVQNKEPTVEESPVVEEPVNEPVAEVLNDEEAQSDEDPIVEQQPVIVEESLEPVVGEESRAEEPDVEVQEDTVSSVKGSSVVEELPVIGEDPTLEDQHAEDLQDVTDPVKEEPIVEQEPVEHVVPEEQVMDEPGTEVLEDDTAPVKEEFVVEELPNVEEPAAEEPGAEVLEDDPAAVNEGPDVTVSPVKSATSAPQGDASPVKEDTILEDEDVASQQATMLVPEEPSPSAVEQEAVEELQVSEVPIADTPLDNAALVIEEPVLEDASISELHDATVGVTEEPSVEEKVAEEPVIEEESAAKETNAEVLAEDATAAKDDPLFEEGTVHEDTAVSAPGDKDVSPVVDEAAVQEVIQEAALASTEEEPPIETLSGVDEAAPEVLVEDAAPPKEEAVEEVVSTERTMAVVGELRAAVSEDDAQPTKDEPAVEEAASDDANISAPEEATVASVQEERVVQVPAAEGASAEVIEKDGAPIKKEFIDDEGTTAEGAGISVLDDEPVASDDQAEVAVVEANRSFKEEPTIDEDTAAIEGTNLELEETHSSPARDLAHSEGLGVEEEVVDISQPPVVDEDAAISEEAHTSVPSQAPPNHIEVESGVEDSNASAEKSISPEEKAGDEGISVAFDEGAVDKLPATPFEELTSDELATVPVDDDTASGQPPAHVENLIPEAADISVPDDPSTHGLGATESIIAEEVHATPVELPVLENTTGAGQVPISDVPIISSNVRVPDESAAIVPDPNQVSASLEELVSEKATDATVDGHAEPVPSSITDETFANPPSGTVVEEIIPSEDSAAPFEEPLLTSSVPAIDDDPVNTVSATPVVEESDQVAVVEESALSSTTSLPEESSTFSTPAEELITEEESEHVPEAEDQVPKVVLAVEEHLTGESPSAEEGSKVIEVPVLSTEPFFPEGEAAEVEPSVIQKPIDTEYVVQESFTSPGDEAKDLGDYAAEDPTAVSHERASPLSLPEDNATSAENIVPLQDPTPEESFQPVVLANTEEALGANPSGIEDLLPAEDSVSQGQAPILEEPGPAIQESIAGGDLSVTSVEETIPPEATEAQVPIAEEIPASVTPTVVAEESTFIQDPAEAPDIEQPVLFSDISEHAPVVEEPIPESIVSAGEAAAIPPPSSSDKPISSDNTDAQEPALTPEFEQVAIPEATAIQEPASATDDPESPPEEPALEQPILSPAVESISLPEDTPKTEVVDEIPVSAAEPILPSGEGEAEATVASADTLPVSPAEEVEEVGILMEAEPVEVTDNGEVQDASTAKVHSELTTEPAIANEPASVEPAISSAGEAEEDPNLEIDSKVTAIEAEVLNGNGHHASSAASISDISDTPLAEPAEPQVEAPATPGNEEAQDNEEPPVGEADDVAPLETEAIPVMGNGHDSKIDLHVAAPRKAVEVNATLAAESEAALPAVEQT